MFLGSAAEMGAGRRFGVSCFWWAILGFPDALSSEALYFPLYRLPIRLRRLDYRQEAVIQDLATSTTGIALLKAPQS